MKTIELFSIPDIIWKAIYFLLSMIVDAVIALYKILLGLIRSTGKIIGIRINNIHDIGEAKAYRELFGWVFIVSLVITFAFIIFNNKVSDRIIDFYSFVVGIVVIPTVLGKTISNKTSKQ